MRPGGHLAVALLALALLTPKARATPPTPEPMAMTISAAQCVAARSVFDDAWRIASDITSPIAQVCGGTTCVSVDIMTGEVIGSARATPPVVIDEPPRPRDALTRAFGVACPAVAVVERTEGGAATDDAAADELAAPRCPALTKVLGFLSERAGNFAPGSGSKARWLVNEVFGDDPMNLTARTHIYDAGSHRHLGSVTQSGLYGAPVLEWVTDRCALVSMPFPSSDVHPRRLLCAGKNRLVSTMGRLDELIAAGPRVARALSDDQLVLWHAGIALNVVRVVSLPSGREQSSYEVPFIDWTSQLATVAPSVFATLFPVLVFADADADTLWVVDPLARKTLRGWHFDDCP